MTAPLPAGTVTLLFTDIEGSAALAQAYPAELPRLLDQHHALVRAAIEQHGGVIFRVLGDAFCAAFETAPEALRAALAAQRALQHAAWSPAAVRVRMGLHTGSVPAGALSDEADHRAYLTLTRAQRVMAAADGEQVLLSDATAVLADHDLPAGIILLDLGEHRLKGLLQPERLWQLAAPELRQVFAPRPSLQAIPHNLPVALTSFIGRERELAEAAERLAATHLLTLTGPGGTGKTRLSLQLATQVLEHYPHGVWLVELAPLADPALLAQTIAAVWGLRDLPGRPLTDLLQDYLRAKTLLLILDNCEHLVEACAQLATELLRGCPRLTILASSREALGIAGETAYRVPSLSLPAAQHPPSLAEAAQYEAVRLFVARAQAVHAAFALTAQNLPAIVQICRRLDGIPLALELAAARVKVLSVAQIAERLDDRFRLLTGGSRTALPRQQTLRALIDWSYDLLPAEECAALRRLSVFAGGWTLPAAEAVLGPDALDWLAHLVDKSLVVVDDALPGGQTRYRLLETIRQYARDKLLTAGEAEATRAQHLAYFLQLTEAAEDRLRGAEMVAALDELEVEQDNLRAALEWALDQDPLAAARLMAVLWSFFGRRASVVEGLRWVQAALGRLTAPPAAPAEVWPVRARVLMGAAALAFQLGQTAVARPAVEAAIAAAREINATRPLALALGMGATIAGMYGEVPRARAWADESLALCRQHGYGYELGMYSGAHMFLAVVAQEGLPPDLRAEMVRAARASGNPWALAMALQNVARLNVAGGDLETAYAGFEETLGLYAQIGDRHFGNASRSEMAHVRRKQGRYAEAAAGYAGTIPVWQELGHLPALARELECLAFIAGATGQAERAARLLGAAEVLRETLSAPMSAIERREYDEQVAALRAHLPAPALEAAWAAGRALTRDEAVAYALQTAADA